MTTSPIWSGIGGSVGRIISLFLIYCMCMIWLNMDIFYWRFVLTIFLSLRALMAWELLSFRFSCWPDISSRTCWTDIGSFLSILRVQTLVPFFPGKALFQGLFFVDWEIYDMLWCSHYCATIPIRITLGGKLKLTSNISFFVNGWS